MTEMRAKLVVEADGSAVVGMAQRVTGGLDTMSGAAEKTAQNFQKVKVQSEAAERMQRRLNTTFNDFGADRKSARESARAFEDATRAQQAYRALEESIDPLIRAERELAAAQKVVNAAVASGVATQDEANRSMQLLQGRYDALAAGQNRVARSSRAMRGGVQNASYQIADAAVQLQAGTAASIVFAQQMPQLLGGMGMIGAVMGAVVALGTPLVSMLLSTEESAGSLDERMNKLDGSLQSVADRLKTLRDQNLSLTFGTMAGDVRDMTEALLALDRAAGLKHLQSVLSESLDFDKETWGQWVKRSLGPGAMTAAPDSLGRQMSQALEAKHSRENYAALTDGRGPSYDEFLQRRQKITDLAEAGEAQKVFSEVKSLILDFAEGGPITGLNDDLLKVLLTLGDVAQKTAEIEAMFNGSALAARQDKEVAKLATSYARQAELAAAISQYGENSSQVDAVRNRHAREALQLRLREMNIEEGSAKEKEALVALEQAQSQELYLRDSKRQKAINATLTSMEDERAVAAAIVTNGELSVEVERLRTEQAKEVLRIRLAELGATDEQIAKAEALLEQQRKAIRDVQTDKVEKSAAAQIASLENQVRINEAILRHGKDSLEVKRLQIDAARAEFEQSLKTLNVSEATMENLRAQWELAKGLAGVDPFGILASAQSLLEAQTKSLAKLQFEQALMGQNATIRRQALALYEAELEIRQRNIDAASELADQIREGALAESDLAAEVARQVDAWEDVQSSAESAIDKIVDAMFDADIPGVFEGVAEEIQTLAADLAIKNPLKNALVGTDYATLSDAGGLAGIWDRLVGKSVKVDPASVAAGTAAQSVARMDVTAATVVIGGGGVSQIMGGVGTDFSAANLSNNPVAGQIWDFFSSKGLAPHQVSGILGHVQVESGFNPQAVGDAGTSFGLFQHHKTRGAGLLDAVGGREGLGDVNAQLEYVWRELKTSEAGVLKKLLASIDVQEATSAFAGFERPAGWSAANPMGSLHWDRRLASAEQALTRFSTTTGTATQNLDVLGGGFDVFGQALSQVQVGSGGGGIFGSLIGLGLKALGLPGFSGGGATGGSDPKRVAGLVHESEYVFDAVSTARIGVANLEAIRRGTMPGYESGGYVSHARGYSFLTGTGTMQPANVTFAPIIAPINNSSAALDMQVQESTDARGQRRYDLVLSDAVATGTGARGGQAAKVMGSRYGLKPRGIARG